MTDPSSKGIPVRIVAVNKSTNRQFYEDARDCRIGLMYTPKGMEVKERVSSTEFCGEYYIPPEKAMTLYDLVCKDTPSDKIISELGLERESPDMVMGLCPKSRSLESF